jgi:hypothetical protein
MSFDYAAKAETATRLIAKFGRTMTLKRKSLSGDEWAPSLENGDVAVRGVDLRIKEADLPSSLVGVVTRKILLEAKEGITVSKRDKLLIGSVTSEIEHLEKLAPAGAVVFWTAYLVA